MRFPLLFGLAGCCLVATARAQNDNLPPAPAPLHVLSFNLRYDNPGDGPNAWSHRREQVAAVFTEHAVDLAGLQEALANQIDDLRRLRPEYDFVGVGREDGRRQGEFSPIFYRRDRFSCEKQGTFWLSPTPETIGSKGWDAALARIATWGVFRDRQTSRELFFVNTHFDHRGEEARRQSARLLLERIAALAGDRPVIVSGDFNTQEDSPALHRLTAEGGGFKLTNSERVSQTPHVGGQDTFNGFGQETRDSVIDFVSVGPGVDVRTHGYYPAIKDGVYVSDHWPVVCELSLR